MTFGLDHNIQTDDLILVLREAREKIAELQRENHILKLRLRVKNGNKQPTTG